MLNHPPPLPAVRMRQECCEIGMLVMISGADRRTSARLTRSAKNLQMRR